jgi:predicted Zn-dependent peptidase
MEVIMEIININGFTLLYEKKTTDIVNIRYIVNAGSSSEIDNKEFGAAHYLEHMLFKGTKFHTYKETNKIADNLGDINAFTSREITVFHLTSLREDFNKAAELLSEMFFFPLINEDEFNREKTVIIEEYQSGIDKPSNFFYNMLFESFWGTAFSHKTVGNKNSIQNMTIDTLHNFIKNYYVIDNFVISVVGNIEKNEVIDKFSQILKSAPSSYYNKPIINNINYDSINYNEFRFYHSSKQSAMALMFKGLSSIDNINNNFVGDVFCKGLGQGMSSLLFDRIREELGLCYGISSWLQCYRNCGDLVITSFLDENNIELARDEIFKIIENVKKNGFDQEQLVSLKKNMLFDIARESETSSDYASMIADDYFINNCKIVSYEDKFNALKTITNEDIINFANKYFNGNAKFVCMTTDR